MLTNGTAKGAEVFVTNNTSLPKYKEETSKLATKILNNLNKLGISNRGVKTRLIPTDTTDVYTDGTRADYYGIIRYAMRGCKIDSGVIKPKGAVPANVQNGEGVPAIIIEHCFLNNSYDYQFFATDEALQRLAKADADAIVEHYNLKLKKQPVCKLEENYLIVDPDITILNIRKKYNSAQLLLDNNLIATNSKIKIDNKEYTIIKLGDINKDGEVNQKDAKLVLKVFAGKENITEIQKIAGDVINDNKINQKDAKLLLKYFSGKIEDFNYSL